MNLVTLHCERNTFLNLRLCVLVLFMFCLGLNASAQDETEDRIVSTDTIGSGSSAVHRMVFHYNTVDTDGKTPIVLSAAIFMKGDFYEKAQNAVGMMLLSHYTITHNAECPTVIDSPLSLEPTFANMQFIVVESDNIGFGLTVDRVQPYLYGEVTAKQNIDALLAAKKLLIAEGYSFGDKLVTAGYSQGGHSTMWINKLIAEGYRSDEISHVDYSIPGGGPYDIVGIYRKLITENYCQYPVALPLIFYNYIFEKGIPIEDILVTELIEKVPEWFDSKLYETVSLNDSIYRLVGGSDGVETSKILSAEIMDSTSKTMQVIMPELRKNSLMYDDWMPSATDSIYFFHSTGDEVVPYLCVENMTKFLTGQGYDNYKLYDVVSTSHSSSAAFYALFTLNLLHEFVQTTTGIKEISMPQDCDALNGPDAKVTVYSITGQPVKSNVAIKNALNGLQQGIYIINGRKYIVPRQ